VLRNVSEAAVVRLAMRTGGVTAQSASAALLQVEHPSSDCLRAARAMLSSMRIRGVLDFVPAEIGFHFVASDDVRAFLAKQDLILEGMSDDEILEEFGEYHGHRVAPAVSVHVNLSSYKSARNAEKRALRQLWQCPSPWDYAQRIQDELKGE
jgi:hypothetical protein